eukprot:5311222-Pleurochrysis_carterae.AAC.2
MVRKQHQYEKESMRAAKDGCTAKEIACSQCSYLNSRTHFRAVSGYAARVSTAGYYVEVSK